MTSVKSERGRFLSIEGVDGAGKSTQLPRIDAWLRGRGRRTRVTREPGGTPGSASRCAGCCWTPGSPAWRRWRSCS